MIDLAEEAAKRAGDVLRRHFGRASLAVEKKGHADYVSDADRSAEETILELLEKEAPGHRYLLEEGGARGDSASDLEWVVDPLDGTTNFLHRYPFFSVSIALRKRGQVLLGVVYDPVRGEMFSAERGEPARLNGVAVAAASPRSLADALVCTGFPFRSREHLDAYLALFKRIFLDSSGIRRDGSAALDLAYVAAGRFDAFFELGLKPWDTAAGSLLVEQAGGRVSDFHGGGGAVDGGDIIAAAVPIHAELVARARLAFPGSRPA